MISSNLKELHKFPPLPTIKEIIKLYKLRALKQLSQNFLLDLRLTDKIVRAAGDISHGEVMEVGPGPGGITRSIFLRNPSKVILVEKDPRFMPALEMLAKLAPCPTTVYRGDVITFNMETMFSEDQRRAWAERSPNIHLIGNLPFSVATRLIILWLEDISQRRNAWKYGRVPMTLTFQHEVAERMIAGEGAPMRCRLSVMCQNWCRIKYVFKISGKSFLPKPEVDVGVVHLTPLEEPVIDLPFKMVEKVVRCLFSSRRHKCVRGIQTCSLWQELDFDILSLLRMPRKLEEVREPRYFFPRRRGPSGSTPSRSLICARSPTSSSSTLWLMSTDDSMNLQLQAVARIRPSVTDIAAVSGRQTIIPYGKNIYSMPRIDINKLVHGDCKKNLRKTVTQVIRKTITKNLV